jgi:K+-transporting ATPase A subunit
MFNKYPDLKDELIRDTAQFEKEATHNFENPDMNFCQLLISLSMFLISVYVFYFYRDLNNEFYNR